jgi:hypothetical protein
MSRDAREEPRPPRPRSQRKADLLEKLRSDVDLWVSSADETYLRITPESIQALREANELAGRHVMRKSKWLD